MVTNSYTPRRFWKFGSMPGRTMLQLFVLMIMPTPIAYSQENVVKPETINYIEGTWVATQFSNWEGEFVKHWQGGGLVAPYLKFTSDGEVSGAAGCNIHHGKYSLNDNTLVFTHKYWLTTRKHCGPVASDFESRFFEVLKGKLKIAVKVDGMDLWCEDNKLKMQLVKRP